MGSRLRVFLTREQDRTLLNLRTADVPQKVKERAQVIRLNAQDNGPIHRCKEVQQLWAQWEQMGLYIFFLPKYCSQMNPIELECQYSNFKNENARSDKTFKISN